MDTARSHFVRSALDTATWLARPPDVDTARPARCPGCAVASRVPGRPLTLHGHGVRARRLQSVTPDGRPHEHTLRLRRYRCTACAAIVTVGPTEIVPRYRVAADVIALALALWSVLRATAASVRARVQAPRPTTTRWTQLRRWARALPQLFPRARLRPGRSRAATAAAIHVLRGFAPPALRTAAPEHQARHGAVAAM